LKILLLAAHADDEVLGMGATIKKLSKKNEFRLVVLTESVTSQYTEKKMLQTQTRYLKKINQKTLHDS
jgi:LmbE family N-acetylglucosaminyl deacetylase